MSFGQFQFRRDTAANWTAANPILLQGEWGLETDTLAVKLGDGVTAWNALGYYSTKIRLGTTVPAGGLGVVGDLYIRSTTGDLYSKTAVATWTLQGNLVGPTGATGAPGVVAGLANLGAVPNAKGSSLDGSNNLVLQPSSHAFGGYMSAADKTAVDNALFGRDSTGAVTRIFRPGDYAGTYDPTGATDSTPSFTAMMTAFNAFNDRAMISLPPGVFKVDPAVFAGFGTAPGTIKGAGRGVTVLIPNSSASDFMKLGLTDGFEISDFAIYNTAAAFNTNAGINTSGADDVAIHDMLFVNLFYDVRVNGVAHTVTTNSTINISGVSPVLTAADVGKPFSGQGIPSGATIATQAGATGTLSVAATTSTTGSFFVDNSIKVSVQRTVHSCTNSSTSSVGVIVNNGDAGDTYIGPDVVMSNGGATTRRRACVELVASGHYEITQCNLTGSAQGILIDPGASQIVAFGFHDRVLCDSCTVNGMTMNATTSTSVIKNIKSKLSWYSGTTAGAGQAGVLTSGVAGGVLNGVTFSNDRFLNNQTHGFQHGYGTDFRWADCDMKGNSSAGSGISDGLNVAANIGNWSINGGKYGGTDTVPTAGNQRYGISVAAGTGDNIKVSPDDLTGNVTGPLSFGATGANCFINGCPGLAAAYSRSASSAAFTTAITLANMFIPKNSQRVSTTYRITAQHQHGGSGLTPTFVVRYGATNDAVGAAPTNAIVVSAVAPTGAANAWGSVTFLVTITALGAGTGNIQGSGTGVQAAAAFATATAARASGAGFLAIDTTADRYLTLSAVITTTAMTVHNATIEVVNY